MIALDVLEAHRPFGDQLADLMEGRPPSAACGTHYVTAVSLTPEALLAIWRSISTERQEAVGTKLLAHYLAELVSDDDGLVSGAPEREAAIRQSQGAFQDLTATVDAALPQVLWYYPDGYRLKLHSRDGTCVETFDEMSDCSADRVDAARRDGGWFGAVLPDGRRYPDDLQPLTAEVRP